MKPEFSRQTFGKKKNEISNFMKILSVGAELFQADGRTDMTRLIVAFRNFAIRLKKTSQLMLCREIVIA